MKMQGLRTYEIDIPDDMFYFLQSDTINMMVHYYKGMYPNFDEEAVLQDAGVFPSIDVKKKYQKAFEGDAEAGCLLACTCAVKPKLIVLDEPVDGLDPVMRRQIWSIMLDDVAVNNTTVVVSSYNLRGA